MGGIIIEGETRFLAFATKGNSVFFGREIAALEKDTTQRRGIGIKIVPLAEGAACVILSVKGSMDAFGDAMGMLNKWRSSVAIDTVPLPERVVADKWPPPKRHGPRFSWAIRAGRRQSRSPKR